MKVDQYVMAYGVDQDRVRALLPEGFQSLRPVLRINAEIRNQENCYLEFNAPVSFHGKRGWLNIDSWTGQTGLSFLREPETRLTQFFTDQLEITFRPAGVIGGCPAEKDNDGCFYFNSMRANTASSVTSTASPVTSMASSPNSLTFIPAEIVHEKKEFCDCEFRWKFHKHDARGKSTGETIPAYCQDIETVYEKKQLAAESAAEIPCTKVLGSYRICFERT